FYIYSVVFIIICKKAHEYIEILFAVRAASLRLYVLTKFIETIQIGIVPGLYSEFGSRRQKHTSLFSYSILNLLKTPGEVSMKWAHLSGSYFVYKNYSAYRKLLEK
ncbi:hypothetical protein ACJX0J_008289, partial [Zea mays]